MAKDAMETQLTVAIAIPTYLREAVLVDTCRQVIALSPPPDEVLVIDQTPEHEPETESYLRAQCAAGRIRWIRHWPPNLPSARNRALAETTADIIIFIDDDVRLCKSFIEEHRKNFRDPKVQAVAGRILQPAAHRHPDPKASWPQLMDYHFFRLDSSRRAENVATFGGGNHSARVRFFKKLGGYDTNYTGWAFREDSDMAIRAWKGGGAIVFDPDAVLQHLAAPAGGCRLKHLHKRLPEWKVSFPATYFAMRHLFPSRWFWHDLLLGNVRRYVLRKENVFHPWRLPWAILSYLYSAGRSCWVSRRASSLHEAWE
ncbi:MAG: glycosyltransferase [Thermoguttaceae bacterium]|jgi:GT2 family glycosyltransferase